MMGQCYADIGSVSKPRHAGAHFELTEPKLVQFRANPEFGKGCVSLRTFHPNFQSFTIKKLR